MNLVAQYEFGGGQWLEVNLSECDLEGCVISGCHSVDLFSIPCHIILPCNQCLMSDNNQSSRSRMLIRMWTAKARFMRICQGSRIS